MSEPNRGRRKGKGKRGRGEKVERPFAHMLETGGMRRLHVRGQKNIRKRMLVHAAAFNLGLLMRKRFGFGTPRDLQGLAAAKAALAAQATTAISHFLRPLRSLFAILAAVLPFLSPNGSRSRPKPRLLHNPTPPPRLRPPAHGAGWHPCSSTGC